MLDVYIYILSLSNFCQKYDHYVTIAGEKKKKQVWAVSNVSGGWQSFCDIFSLFVALAGQ